MSGEPAADSPSSLPARAAGLLRGWALDATVAVLSLLMMVGIGLDARSHAEGMSFAEEGFVTPEHAFFYSMFLGIAAVIGAATYRERRRGADWIAAVPDGYGWSVVGVVLFGLGGLGDYLWHSTFGFEQGLEVLLSPTHMALAAGGTLFLASPLRASLRREESPGGLVAVPTVISAGLVASVFALFGGYANPVANPTVWSGTEAALTAGLPGFVVFPAVLVAVGLTLSRAFDLPVGALAVAFAFPAAISVTVGYQPRLALAPVVAGLVGDCIARYARPTLDRPVALRAFGAGVGLAFGLSFMALAASIHPIRWVVHVSSGAVVTAGVAGLLVTYVALPDGTVTET